MRSCLALPLLILGLCQGCTGSHEMDEPWGSPAPFSTGLPDRTSPPRDLAMFNGENGRVIMWADLMRLVRRSDVIVVSAPPGPVADMVCRAYFEDAAAAFPPVAEIACTNEPEPCAAQVADASGRRRLVRCGPGMDLPALSASIRARDWGKVVTTMALVPGTARSIEPGEIGRADVVVHLGPTP